VLGARDWSSPFWCLGSDVVEEGGNLALLPGDVLIILYYCRPRSSWGSGQVADILHLHLFCNFYFQFEACIHTFLTAGLARHTVTA
jgi:hypothetical protein